MLIPGDTAAKVIAFILVLSFGGLSIYLLGAQRRAGDIFAVNEQGIWRLRRKSDSLFIAWNKAAVRADDAMQRLIVSDQANASTIWLEYQLKDFETLRDYVLKHIQSSPSLSPTGVTVFHRTWINKIIMAISFFIGLALTDICASSWLAALFCLALSITCIGSIVCDPLKLTIETDRLVIGYPGWNREIALTDISSAALTDESSRGNVWAVVTIALKSRKPIKLYRFREGSVALADALQRALRAAGSAS